MILGFQPSFVPFVRDGSKTHTIRKYDHRNWRVGSVCDCYENVRQKNMALIGRWPCVALDDIVIEILPAKLRIEIDGVLLTQDEVELFAWKDGFRPAQWFKSRTSEGRREELERAGLVGTPWVGLTPQLLMRRWWQWTHQVRVFQGRVIHWDFAKPLYRTANGKYGALKP